MDRATINFFLSLTVGLCLVGKVLAKDAPPRLALVSSGDKKAAAMAALMEVDLSSRDDVVLLDRAEVGKVLAEHKLLFDGLLSMDAAIKVGQLLKCDVFAELHSDAASRANAETISLVAFDALTGVRLYDRAVIAKEDLAVQASFASDALVAGLSKWQGGDVVPDCRTLSFVSTRRTDLPDPLKHLPETVEALLQRQLVNTPDVALLDRKRLNLIASESMLTGARRDRLLASCALVDLDLSKGSGDTIIVKVHMTDGSDRDLAGFEVVDSVLNVDQLVVEAAGMMVKKLKLRPMSEVMVEHGFEADRFLADAERLQLRARSTEAEASFVAATLLAESALRREPDNVRIQKLICRLHQREAGGAATPWEAFVVLEGDFKMMEKWEYQEDVKWFLNGYCDVLHSTLGRLRSDAEKERIDGLRKQVGRWARSANERYPGCIQSVRAVEAWALTAKELLEDAGVCLPSLPNAFSSARYTSSTNHCVVNPGIYFYQIEEFTRGERNDLLGNYEKWGRSGESRVDLFSRMHSHICAAMLVNDFPADFLESEHLMKNNLAKAADLVLQDPTLAGPLVSICMDRGNKVPSFYKPLPTGLIADEVRRVAEVLDGRKVACPLLLEYLDEYDADNAAYPGSYLKKAWAQLKSPDYKLPSGDVFHPRYADWYVEWIEKSFAARYGRDIDILESDEIEIAEVESISRVFDFEALPGISSIESAELDGDWLYILALHTDPRSYEMRRLNMADCKTEILGEIVTDLTFRARTGNEISIGKKAVYVPTEQGVMCFSTDTTNTWMITDGNGLPAQRVTACREAGDTLYLGCRGSEDGYLVRCDIKGNDMKILACSGRKEKKSGLDDCAPYTIDSIVYDERSMRMFIACMFLDPAASGVPWLWSLDVKKGTLSNVHRKPYHPLQLRPLGGGDYLIHIAEMNDEREVTRVLHDGKKVQVKVIAPSADGARGYAIWSAGTYRGEPLDDLTDVVVPLMSSIDPERLKIRYSHPDFSGRLHMMPGTASSAALLREKFLVSSAVRRTPMALDPTPERDMLSARAGFERRWQLIPRNDIDWETKDLPLLDGEAPFIVREYQDNILAITQDGAWLVTPRLPGKDIMLAKKAKEIDKGALQSQKRGGSLVVNAPNGAVVSIDDDPPYRVWKDNVLTWSNMSVGEHSVKIEFFEDQTAQTVDVQAGKTTAVRETFEQGRVVDRILEAGEQFRMEMVWVPPVRTEVVQANQISFGDGFWMSKYEVTQAQYEGIMSNNPSSYRGLNNPVDSVRMQDAEEFCRRINKRCASQLSPFIMRLPSVEQWDYACKGLAETKYGDGDLEEDLQREAWPLLTAAGRTHSVGLKMRNRYGLFDMRGNVEELCECSGWSWEELRRRYSDQTGFRVVLSATDAELSKDKDGWTHLAYIAPAYAKAGWGSVDRHKHRNWKPVVGGSSFETVILAHAPSSIKYNLSRKYKEFEASYGLKSGAGGAARFVVIADGEEKFRSGEIYSYGGTSKEGVKSPVKLDVTDVDVLELKTIGVRGGASAWSAWGNPKVR